MPLQTPIIILGGILLGVFTPTEAAAVAVAYAIIVGFFVLQTMKLRDLPDVLTRAAHDHVGGAAAGRRGDGVQDRRQPVATHRRCWPTTSSACPKTR